MKVLLDECLPRKFRNLTPDHECHSVPELSASGMKNGEAVSGWERGFDVFVTLDRGIESQQNLQRANVAVILIGSKSSRLSDLQPYSSRILVR